VKKNLEVTMGRINTNGTNGSVLSYCEFSYGGNSSYSTTLSIESGSSAKVENCTIAHNSRDDASVTNQYNGIFVETINVTTRVNVSRLETEVPFVIDDNANSVMLSWPNILFSQYPE
jgi:hypothetical protein